LPDEPDRFIEQNRGINVKGRDDFYGDNPCACYTVPEGRIILLDI